MGWGVFGDIAEGAKDLASGAVNLADDAIDDAGKAFDQALDAAGDTARGVGRAVSNASISDIGHTALDVAGMVPVIGEAADLANAGWYAAEGDYTNAALSAAAAVPFAGNAATAAKWGKKAVDAADLITDAAKVADKVGDGAKVADTIGDTAKIADGGLPSGFRAVHTGGKRGEVPLTNAQQAEVSRYAETLGIPDDVVRFSDNMNTSYGRMFGADVVYVGSDVMPSANAAVRAESANARISMKGAMAHEWVGHQAAARANKTQPDAVLEEAQASIRAARFGPELSSTERVTLLRDGVERLHNAGLSVADVRDKLWINTP